MPQIPPVLCATGEGQTRDKGGMPKIVKNVDVPCGIPRSTYVGLEASGQPKGVSLGLKSFGYVRCRNVSAKFTFSAESDLYLFQMKTPSFGQKLQKYVKFSSFWLSNFGRKSVVAPSLLEAEPRGPRF